MTFREMNIGGLSLPDDLWHFRSFCACVNEIHWHTGRKPRGLLASNVLQDSMMQQVDDLSRIPAVDAETRFRRDLCFPPQCFGVYVVTEAELDFDVDAMELELNRRMQEWHDDQDPQRALLREVKALRKELADFARGPYREG